MKDAETGQRGHIITGEQNYLEPYRKAVDSIRASIQKAKQLTTDNPAQQGRIAEIERLTGSKLDEFKETIDLRAEKGFEYARKVVATNRGQQLMDNIVQKIGEIESEERTLLKQRSEDALMSAETTMAMVLWGTLVCLALSGALAFFVIRAVNGALQVAIAASQVCSSSGTLAQGCSEQAASLEETSASSEEINAMARKNSENSLSAAELVTQSEQKFVQTNQSLNQMLVAIAEINTQSNKIAKVIKIIDEIAFQTNILALNAAVEAARAGQSGMGFAVVADEVRSLAQRCRQAATDTAALIEESIAKSSDGRRMVEQVAGAVRAVTEEAAQVRLLVAGVNLGSQEQARGIEQINKALAQMEQVTLRTAAGAEESASAGRGVDGPVGGPERDRGTVDCDGGRRPIGGVGPLDGGLVF